MKRLSYLLAGLAALGMAACSDDDGSTDPQPIRPAALIRYINAMPDTGVLDFRIVDEPLENLPSFQGVAFRGSSGLFQRVQPGNRAVRVFLNDTLPAVASLRLFDGRVQLDADKRYTFLHIGAGRVAAGSATNDTLRVIEEQFNEPAASAGNIKLRVIHANPDVGTINVRVGAVGSALTAPVRSFTGLTFGTVSPYVELPAFAFTSTSLYQFAVEDAAAPGTALFLATPAQPGDTATVTRTAQPGVRIPGSVLTAIIYGRAPAGARGAVTANATPTVVIYPDRPLP